MNARLRILLAGLGALLLAACSGGTDRPTLHAQLFGAVRDEIAARTAPEVQRPPLTRASLDTVELAAIEVTLEQSGTQAYLFEQLVRRDDAPGRITVWRTEDDVTLALREGVLIATRGLGGDLLSSAVQVETGRPGPAGGGAHVMHVAARDNKAVPIRLACDLEDLGATTITIVERAHPVRHLRETCETVDGARVVNDYWVETRGGLVWQSRQWAGPTIGYLRIRQLTR